MNIILSILVFSLIVIIHELGHFLLAKKNQIFVTEFSIGMGQRVITLVKTKKGYRPRFFLSQHDFEKTPEWKDSTKYSWKLFPVGGSCMMMGEDENLDDGRAFNKRGVWARISVIFAGPLFNFILAFILAMIIVGMVGSDPARVIQVEENSAAQEAGLLPGDIITNINGSRIDIGREYEAYLQFNSLDGRDLMVSYTRKGEKGTNKIKIAPTKIDSYRLGIGYTGDATEADLSSVELGAPFDKAGMKQGDIIKMINDTSITSGSELSQYFQDNPLTSAPIYVTYQRNGDTNSVEITPVAYSYITTGFYVNTFREKTNVTGVLKYSAVEVKYFIVTTIKSLGHLITGKISTKEMAGPVGIVNMIGDTYESSKRDGMLYVFLNMILMSIMLSANLGIMNLLPIPALDGGRLIFLFLEAFRGKPIDQNKEGLVHMIGLIALMILMVFVMFNDISRLF